MTRTHFKTVATVDRRWREPERTHARASVATGVSGNALYDGQIRFYGLALETHPQFLQNSRHLWGRRPSSCIRLARIIDEFVGQNEQLVMLPELRSLRKR